MPANRKYLLKTRLGRTSKLVAASVGGLFATISVLSLIGLLGFKKLVVLTIWFVFPSVWVFFIAIVYWIKKPRHAWGVLSGITLLCAVGIYFLR